MTNNRLNILQLLLTMGETSAAYNEHCLPAASEQNISICTYFKPAIIPAKGIPLFAGDSTLPGFFRALRVALDSQDYDIIHAHSVHVATFLLLAHVILRWRFTLNTVYTLHSSYSNYKVTNKLMLFLTIIFFQRIVCCSHASLESLPSAIRHFAGDKLCVIQNGIDIERIDQVIEKYTERRHNHLFTVTAIGRLIEVKNPLSILRSFQKSNTNLSRLIFIGEGHLRATLLKEIAEHRLGERVKLVGLIPRDKVYEHLMETDILISTSLIEGLPVAVLEAMACRCPVILSNIASHREIASNADFISLIPVDDTTGFSREIKRFQELPVVERLRIGEECRKLVEERFSLARMHKEYRIVYSQLLNSF